ncbi:MAG: hypothetical protein PPP58_10700 [Natronomonas sp.]
MGQRDPVERSTYEFVRSQGGVLTALSIPGKIRLAGVASLAAAGMLPLLYLLPEGVRELYFDVEPVAATIGIALVAGLGIGNLLAGGVGLVALVVRRANTEEMTESRAWSLVGLEGICSGLILITGLLAVAVTLGLAGLGFAGTELVETAAGVGVQPYATVAYDISVGSIAVFGLVSGVVLLGFSVYAGRVERDSHS